MNKSQLIALIAASANLTKADARRSLECLVAIVTENLKKGQPVTVTGFGTFKVSHRKARAGVDPQNPRERISIPPMTLPCFKPGKTLKDAVRGSG